MAELTPAGAAEYAACFLARWASYADGSSDEPPGDLAPEYLRVLLAERDQLRDRLTAARAATEEWHAFALEHRDDPDRAAQAAWRAMAHALCCVLTAHDGEPADAAHPLGVVEFPQDITDEEMTRWAAAWEAAQGPERPLTLDLGNRTATFRAKPWPAEYDAVARETAEQTPNSEGNAP